MKKVLVFTGSPRPRGNSTILSEHFIEGAKQNTDLIELVNPYEIKIDYCRACLRCNILKRCSIQNDDWNELSKKILNADVLVFASPVYFHHLPAPLKIIIDRFRSFVNVQITEKSLIHTPTQKWNKDFVLLLTMGSSDDVDADSVIDIFKFMSGILGAENKLHIIKATRLAGSKQIEKNVEELGTLYRKLGIPENLAKDDYYKNLQILKRCFELGGELSLGLSQI